MRLQLDALSQRFLFFGERECRGVSPLYEYLSLRIAEDETLLALSSHARQGQPVPNLFFAAVHYLLLQGARHPLAAFYTNISGAASAPGDDAYPHFRDFCLERADDILALLRTRLVQTNVVERCASLMPAFMRVSDLAGGGPLAMIEVGASAGLNLLWDRYGYDYGEGRRYGDESAPVQVRGNLVGNHRPAMSRSFPAVSYRVGIDLNPIDPANSDDALWLKALVWPENRERFERMERAIAMARADPPKVLEGDALELLPSALAQAPTDSVLCVFHTHTLNQFTPDMQQRFVAILRDAGRNRVIYWVSSEGIGKNASSLLELVVLEEAQSKARLLAYAQPHARWLEWVDAPQDDNWVMRNT
ncbi:MAG: DUF2332 domain-containing protein [Chloroflexi bacterium]|nr:DUF2332 domain-containing protein [Chloroflexota bacterium]